MKAERTIDTRAVVTPNFAVVRRSHTSSYTMLHRPDKKKNSENHIIGSPPLKWTRKQQLNALCSECESGKQLRAVHCHGSKQSRISLTTLRKSRRMMLGINAKHP